MTSSWIPDLVWWQPIVDVARRPGRQPLPIVIGGEVFLRPAKAAVANCQSWWDGEVAAGRGVLRQIDLEIDTLDALDIDGMDAIPRWHLNVHPAVPPVFRDLMDHWLDLHRTWPIVWELDWDRTPDPAVLQELDAIKLRSLSTQWRAANHVGRQGLTLDALPDMCERLAGFDLVKLDHAAFAVVDDAGFITNDEGWEALQALVAVLDGTMPIIAVGVERAAESALLRDLGILWQQGDWFHWPIPIRPFFQVPPIPADQDQPRLTWIRRIIAGRLAFWNLQLPTWSDIPWWLEEHDHPPQSWTDLTWPLIWTAMDQDPLVQQWRDTLVDDEAAVAWQAEHLTWNNTE